MLTVDQMAHTFAVHPSLSGIVTEAARRLMRPVEDRRRARAWPLA
jgi:dihydrolipoamide dehydrogenase